MARHSENQSEQLGEDLVTDPYQIELISSKNVLRQYDRISEIIQQHADGRSFKLRPSFICEMNRLAIEGLKRSAGLYRSGGMTIIGSNHSPPVPHEIPALVEDMCEYVNDHPDHAPLHIAAYLMWRINWIHPFVEGNGRTSRAVSYALLSIRLERELPGTPTIPDQIVNDRDPYYGALDQADAAWRDRNEIDVSAMESLMAQQLATQLVGFHDQATRAK